MKTGLTKKQKVTEVYYNAKDPTAEVYTHDTKLKKRLPVYATKPLEYRAQNVAVSAGPTDTPPLL